MRVLGAIDYAEGKSRRERIKKVSEIIFTDENGDQFKFTWRTISTWYCRYSKHGITGVESVTRSDKGMTWKIAPEELLEAINEVLPLFRQKRYNKMDIFRKIIEKGIIGKDQLAQTTFYRFVREYELLGEGTTAKKKRRLAFAMQYANQLWQGALYL